MASDIATLIALAWVIGLTGLSIILVYHDETNDGWHHHNRLIAAVTAMFVVAPFITGLLHRSVRVGVLVTLFGAVGWWIAGLYQMWAYANIGGGP